MSKRTLEKSLHQIAEKLPTPEFDSVAHEIATIGDLVRAHSLAYVRRIDALEALPKGARRMIEFNLTEERKCAINPALVTAILPYPQDNRTIICFGSDDSADVYVIDPYEDVLAKIRAANTGGKEHPADV